jgi:hypothetical protein
MSEPEARGPEDQDRGNLSQTVDDSAEVHDAFPLRSITAPQSWLAGFTSAPESWQQWLMAARRTASGAALSAAAFLITGCQLGVPPPQTASRAPTVDARQKEIDDRKDEMMRQLAHCESGGWGPSDRPIYGGRGAYLGRLQFSVQTVIGYQLKRDGTQLSRQEAIDLAHDYDRAASLAKYMIFELEEPWHWPLCSRKISLRNEMANIRELTNQAALVR